MSSKEQELERIITGLIADKFPEFFDEEGQDYGKLHRLEELGKELSEAITNHIEPEIRAAVKVEGRELLNDLLKITASDDRIEAIGEALKVLDEL